MTDEVGIVTSAALLTALAKRQAETAAEIYEQLTEAFVVANNLVTAEAFRELSEGGWRLFDAIQPLAGGLGPLPRWGETYPEISDPDSVHFLMPPYYAFELARRHETTTLVLLEAVAEKSADAEIRAQAQTLLELFRPRVAAIEARRNDYPKPPHGWWIDEDGPHWESEF